MKKSKNVIDVFWVVLLVGIVFALLISTANAYYHDDYDENREEDPWGEEDINEREDDDAVGYYDYAGEWHEIPEPDPYYPVSHSRSHRSLSPVSMMMPLLIVFFVVFLPWLAYALGKE